ncbi:MAG: DNA repair ATPase, partial [bacterium]|nr:DNA repair ATPase [bacterium]
MSGALGLAETPEKCDEQLSKLMLQLKELESRFGEFDQFIEQLATKREDVYEAFSSKKQSLVDARHRRAQRMMQAAERILEGIVRRAKGLQSSDELNTYFVGDSMVAKVREIPTQLREIGDSVKAEELDSRLKSSKEDAARALRDRQDIFEEGTSIIKLGRHRFSVNEQPFDLTMVPYEDGMGFHLTGTDFHEMVADDEFEATREYWDQLVISETNEVYRGEYLAASILFDAEEEKAGLRLPALHEAVAVEGGLLELVRKYAAERYEEGYERGLHDHDAALILERLLALYETADLLRFAPRPRACAGLFWAFYGEQMTRALWERRAHSLARLRSSFAHSPAISELQDELGEAIGEFFTEHRIEIHPDDMRLAGAYLFEELAQHPLRFTTSAEATELRDRFQKYLRDAGTQRDFTSDLEELQDDFTNRHQL